jgi:hypothetical protein
MKNQKQSHLMNRYLPSLGLALLIAIPFYTPAHATTQERGATTYTPPPNQYTRELCGGVGNSAKANTQTRSLRPATQPRNG